MEAIWGLDYDFHTDKCFNRPSCPECKEPIWKDTDGKYYCVNCGKEISVLDPKMKEWLSLREETKIEYRNCIKTKSFGCGGEKCVKTLYVRNKVTLEWQIASGYCEKCGFQYIV